MASLSSLVFYTLSIVSATLHVVDGLTVTAIASETEAGGNATLRCEKDLQGGTGLLLVITRGNAALVTSVINVDPDRVTLSPSDSRYSYNSSTQTMTIADVQCADETNGPFTCKLTGLLPDGNSREVEDSKSITVRVPPKSPDTLITSPTNLTSGIVENLPVSATCNANTGRPGKGRIVWRIFRGSDTEDVQGNDARVTETEIGPTGEDRPCTERFRSTLRLASVTRQDQNLVVTCFVLNDDFQSSLPATCNDDDADLCRQSMRLRVFYGVDSVTVNQSPSMVYEGESVSLTCQAVGNPAPSYRWFRGDQLGANSTVEVASGATYVIVNASAQMHNGVYHCMAENTVNGDVSSGTANRTISVEVRPTNPPTTDPPTDPTEPLTQRPPKSSGSDDDTTIIIVVVVVVVVAVVVVAVAVYCLKCRRTKEVIEEPPEKPYYNNRQNLAFQSSQPDLVTVDSKKPTSPSLNNSFDMNEDGLRYADLTYDNRPRSRKPMAIGDTSSEYSDVQMPQV